VTPHNPHPAEPTLGEAKAIGNTSDVDVDQQLLSELASGNSFPDIPLTDIHLSKVYLDGSVSEEGTCPHVVEEEMVVAFGL